MRETIESACGMDFFLQLLFAGVGIGAVYALVALGFVLIFRATSVVNFAQGEFSMVAAYLMVVFAVDLGWPYWLAFLIAIAGMALLGAAFNLAVYYPLRNRTYLPVLISTIGASIFLSNTVLALYGPQPQVLPGWLDTPGFQLGPVYLDSQYLIIIGVTLALVAFQYWLFERTLLGKKLQATSQDKEMAALLGIPVAAMIMITFVYSAVLGGIAGILVAPVLFVSIQMGSTIALKAFAATIIGGFGDVAGAIVGGFAIGVIETFGAAYISVPFKDAFAFLVLILFLILAPARRVRRAGRGEGMSGTRRSLRGQAAYGLFAIAVVALAASVKTDGYVANILMQASTYAIAVIGLSIVLGLCGQINLAQAAFFALGAYSVGLGTADYRLPFWLCLAAGVAIAVAAGAGLGVSTLRLGGHYLAMVTISFQQILTVVLINAIGFSHGPDGVSSIARPGLVRLRPGVPRARRRDARGLRLFRLAASRHAARARDARGARQ